MTEAINTSGLVASTAPKWIYLVIGADCPPDVDFSELSEVSWCDENIDGNGIEYVRSDLAAPPVTASQAEPIRYTNDGELAECPCCGSLDVGGAQDTVNCYGCGLQITKPRPLKNATAAWNMRTGRKHTTPTAAAVVPDWLLSKGSFCDRLYAAGWRDHADAQGSEAESLRLELLARLNPAPDHSEHALGMVPEGWREAAVEAAYAAVVEGGWSSVKEMGVEMFQAGAAWQRTQAAGVPEGYVLVPVASLERMWRFIDPAPMRMPNGDTMTFQNPHAAAALREISAEFRAMLAAPAPEPASPQTCAARDVLAERQRQITAEGWTPEHDDEHATGELALAAAGYAAHAHVELHGETPLFWPWDKSWWKPACARRDLVRAGALILAEIERLDRAEQPAKGGQS